MVSAIGNGSVVRQYEVLLDRDTAHLILDDLQPGAYELILQYPVERISDFSEQLLFPRKCQDVVPHRVVIRPLDRESFFTGFGVLR